MSEFRRYARYQLVPQFDELRPNALSGYVWAAFPPWLLEKLESSAERVGKRRWKGDAN